MSKRSNSTRGAVTLAVLGIVATALIVSPVGAAGPVTKKVVKKIATKVANKVFESKIGGATAGNADKLDGKDSSQFVGSGAPAGGDLTGTYPNPSIGANSVSGAKVANDSLTGDDVLESSLGTVPNASSLGGQPASSYPRLLSGPGLPAVGMNFYSYFMTTSVVTRFDFGQAAIETTGTAGQFKICGDGAPLATFNFVVYVNGVRTAGTVGGAGCSAAFDAGAGGDFRASIRRAQIFGVHSGDGTANENYNIYGFSQL